MKFFTWAQNEIDLFNAHIARQDARISQLRHQVAGMK